MNINNAQMHRVLELHLNKVYSSQPTTGIDSMRRPDELILSPKAKDMQEIQQTIKTLPNVRTGMVQDLKSKIDAGSYDMDNQETADSMLSSIMNNMRIW